MYTLIVITQKVKNTATRNDNPLLLTKHRLKDKTKLVATNPRPTGMCMTVAEQLLIKAVMSSDSHSITVFTIKSSFHKLFCWLNN